MKHNHEEHVYNKYIKKYMYNKKNTAKRKQKAKTDKKHKNNKQKKYKNFKMKKIVNL